MLREENFNEVLIHTILLDMQLTIGDIKDTKIKEELKKNIDRLRGLI